MTIALIFIPSALHVEFAQQCYAYCHAKSYGVFGVVAGDWAEARKLARTGVVGVLVLARPEHLIEAMTNNPESEGTRIEFAAPPDIPHSRRNERRTHITRPNAAA